MSAERDTGFPGRFPRRPRERGNNHGSESTGRGLADHCRHHRGNELSPRFLRHRPQQREFPQQREYDGSFGEASYFGIILSEGGVLLGGNSAERMS